MQFLKEKLEKANAKIEELETNSYQKYEVTADLLESFDNQNNSSLKFYLINQGAVGAPEDRAGIVESFKSLGRKLWIFKINGFNTEIFIHVL